MSVEANSPARNRSRPHDKAPRKKTAKSDHRDKSSRHESGEKKRKREQQRAEERPSPSKRARSDTNVRPMTEETSQPLDSPFHSLTSSLYLPLSPICQLHPLEGLCAEHLSPLVLTYYPPFHAVILSYSNVRLSERPSGSTSAKTEVLARSIDEYAVSYVWVTADFLLFKPQKGEWIEGWINLQNEGHLGLVCWNLFNASIERKRLPTDWKWIAAGGDMRRAQSTAATGDGSQQEVITESERGEGYYEDAAGKKIEGMVRFRVRDLETSFDRDKGFLSIEGTMLDDQQENAMQQGRRGRGGQRRATNGGALTNGGHD